MRNLRELKARSVLIWLFLFLISSLQHAAASDDWSSDEEAVWERLIYFSRGGFLINNEEFLLSYPNASPTVEKKMTIDGFRKDANLICKYPARYQHLLGTGDIERIEHSCPELDEYRNRVPIDDFYFIFAGKDLRSTTSMMGHGLLAVSGIDSHGATREHAFTFLADLRNAKLLPSLYMAFVSGLDGVFSLKPLSEEISRYSQIEKREVWKLRLKFKNNQKEFLKLALWELKDARPSYRFQSFNCATLTLHTLSIAAPHLLRHEKVFVSPVDIYKAISEEKLIAETELILDETHLANDLNEYSTNIPIHEIQDSNFGLVIGEITHLTFLGAANYFHTPSNGNRGFLKIGALKYDVENEEIADITLYEVLDLNNNSGTSIHMDIGIYRDRYSANDKMNASILMSLGKTISTEKLSASLLFGGRLDGETGINPILEHYLAVNIAENGSLTTRLVHQSLNGNAQLFTKSSINWRLSEVLVGSLGLHYNDTENEKGSSVFLRLDYHF